MAINIIKLIRNIARINWPYIITMGLVAILIGVIISVQTKLYASKDTAQQVPTRQLERMVALLKDSEEKKESLEKQLTELRKQLEKIQESPSTPLSEEQLNKVYRAAGLTEVKGIGIEVIIDDIKASKQVSPNNDGVVHSDDLLKLVNELKSAGAMAISINNQRIVTTTEIIEAGNSIIVNQTRLVAPYTIKAIGDPETLKVALSFRGSIVEYLRFYDIDVTINTPQKEISIPPYTGKL